MSNGSEGASSVRSRIITKEDEEAEFIADSDIEDATSVVSLGTKISTEPEQQLSFQYKDEQEISFLKDHDEAAAQQKERRSSEPKRGYIDDAIVRDVMKGADDRLRNERNTSWTKTIRILYGIFVVTMFSLAIAAVVKMKHNSISQTIKDKGTAFDFHDEDEFFDPESDVSFWDEELPLEPGIIIPPAVMLNLVDTKEGRFTKDEETPFFFQIPFSGSVAQSLMTACLHLVLASNYISLQDTTATSDEPEALAIDNINEHLYVNVDLSTAEGIEDAAKRGLKDSGLADVIVSSHVNYASNLLFDSDNHKGRLFTILRHPIDRAIATYYEVITKNPDLSDMTLADYVHSTYVNDSDWMTRFLTNKRQERIGPEHLQLAKEILRKKCLVGLYDEIEASFQLFQDYYGWVATNEKSNEMCHTEIIANEHERAAEIFEKVGHLIDVESDEYQVLYNYNKYDLELYWYGVEVFKEQQEWISGMQGKN